MVERQIDRAFAKVLEELRAGLRHGHFQLTVQCITAQHGTRRLVVESGKRYKFEIPTEELDDAE